MIGKKLGISFATMIFFQNMVLHLEYDLLRISIEHISYHSTKCFALS